MGCRDLLGRSHMALRVARGYCQVTVHNQIKALLNLVWSIGILLGLPKH